MFRVNKCKAKLLEGRAAYGLIHGFAHPRVAEMMGIAGCDFVLVDGEHGAGGHGEHYACLQAISATPATAMLRVMPGDFDGIRKALDAGFEGVMVPDVHDAAEARAAVSACHYPPRGTRGFSAGTVRATDYGQHVAPYLAGQAAELLVCLMIESAAGVRNVKSIAAVEGVDVVQVGPFDLSYDLGIPGQFEHPEFLQALQKIEAGVKRAGKVLGGVPLPGMPLETVLERGYRMITLGADVPMLGGALRTALAAIPDSGSATRPKSKPKARAATRRKR